MNSINRIRIGFKCYMYAFALSTAFPGSL